MEYDLISIGAHPDDVEVGTGGVLIDLAKRAKCIALCAYLF